MTTKIYGTNLMNFMTASQYIKNREPKCVVLGKSGKVGRRSRPKNERIRTIAWFNTIRLALEVNTPTSVGAKIQSVSDVLGPKGWSGDIKDPSLWSRYAKGNVTPNNGKLSFINNIVPGSIDLFLSGPSSLWDALWGDNVYQLQYEDIEELIQINPNEIDLNWLSRAIRIWRKRADIASSGALNNFPDGLYEAIAIALTLPAVKLPLEELKVLDAISLEIRLMEAENISSDFEKIQEIKMMGHNFLKLDNPIESYLLEPVDFFKKIIFAIDIAI